MWFFLGITLFDVFRLGGKILNKEEIMLDVYFDIFNSYLPSGSKHASKCVEINCPCCTYMGEKRNDNKRRGGLFFTGDEIGYNCFNCGFKFRATEDSEIPFRAIKLLELMFVPKEEINKLHFLSLRKNPQKRLLGVKQKSKINLDFKEVDLPKNSHLLHNIIMDVDEKSDAFQAFIYAKSRGVENYPFLVWADNKSKMFNKRLILPYLYKHKIVGYTARAFVQTPKLERFVNICPNPNYVFNIDSIFSDKKILIINESPFDSLLYDGVGIMSFSPNQQQIDIINNFKGRKILVPDLNTSGKKMIDVATKNNWEVFFPYWNSNFDLGESVQNFGKIFVLHEIINKSLSDDLQIQIQKNLL